MAKESDESGGLRNWLVPTAAGVAGSAVAVALTKKPKRLADVVPKQLEDIVPRVREAMPDLPSGGVGEITEDLRGRLDSVLGKDESDESDEDLGGFAGQQPRKLDADKYEQRRAERRERREQRRRRAR
jgi:hypothetical protein